MAAFRQRKAQRLARADASRKGGLDERAAPVVRLLNGRARFCTTSSCSGRLVLAQGGAAVSPARGGARLKARLSGPRSRARAGSGGASPCPRARPRCPGHPSEGPQARRRGRGRGRGLAALERSEVERQKAAFGRPPSPLRQLPSRGLGREPGRCRPSAWPPYRAENTHKRR